MLMGEPPQSPWDLHFRLFGIPVRVHPYFWLLTLLLVAGSLLGATNARGFLFILAPWVPAVFLGVLVHELGHAAAMRAYGRRPWITLYGLGGLTSSNTGGLYHSAGFATLGQIMISVAGPVAGFVLAAVVALFVWGTGHSIGFELGVPYGLSIRMEPIGSEVFTAFIYYVLIVSIYWGVLNLLPIDPLDGGQIAREFFLKLSPHEGIRQSLALSVATAGGLAVMGLVVWGDVFIAIVFGYLAYSNYATLQAHRARW